MSKTNITDNAPVMRVPLSKIKANPANPRIIKDAGYVKNKRSVAQFPQMLAVRGLAVVREGEKWMTIGGNQRYRVLCDLKKEMSDPDFMQTYECNEAAFNTLIEYFAHGVPCFDCTGFTDEQVRRFIIADNVSAGEWDTESLANEWDVEELQEWGLPDWIINESREDEQDDRRPPNVKVGTKIEVLIVDPTLFDSVMDDIQAVIARYPGVIAQIA